MLWSLSRHLLVDGSGNLWFLRIRQRTDLLEKEVMIMMMKGIGNGFNNYEKVENNDGDHGDGIVENSQIARTTLRCRDQ